MSKKLVLAIDQGTTATTCLIINEQLEVVGKASSLFRQIFPADGWVEHEPHTVWVSVEETVAQALTNAQAKPQDIAAIGVTNQRETTCLFRPDSSPLANFIVWQCRRTADICAQLKNRGLEKFISRRTGLVLDPYFSATKLMWFFENIDNAKNLANKGEALFGTIDTWLVHKMTAGRAFVSDSTNASRTMMMNLESCQWDPELLSIFQVPIECLPKICSSSEIYGETCGLSFLPDGIPIAGIAGDQQAALFGQACFNPGDCKATFGTGCFMLVNTGKKIVRSHNGLLSSVAIDFQGDRQYCLEGSSFIAGAAVQWLKDCLGLIETAEEIEELAGRVEDSAGVVFVPALTGLGAPYWRPEARGLLSGMTRDTTKAHIARAVLEGITLLNRDIVMAMTKDEALVRNMRVDGGASQNNLLIQMHADFLGITCVRPKIVEITALGAAALAGLAIGLFQSKKWLAKTWDADRQFKPQLNRSKLAKVIARWDRAVQIA